MSLIYEVATTRPKNKHADALGKTLTTLIFLTLRGQIGSWMTNFLQGRLHHLAWPLPDHHETAIPNPIIWQPKIETDILRFVLYICFMSCVCWLGTANSHWLCAKIHRCASMRIVAHRRTSEYIPEYAQCPHHSAFAATAWPSLVLTLWHVLNENLQIECTSVVVDGLVKSSWQHCGYRSIKHMKGEEEGRKLV